MNSHKYIGEFISESNFETCTQRGGILYELNSYIFTNSESTNFQTLLTIEIITMGGLLQGQPLGFDTKYLALVDRNMQVRFSLKVVWES